MTALLAYLPGAAGRRAPKDLLLEQDSSPEKGFWPKLRPPIAVATWSPRFTMAF
jgi:hypothetical protein